MNGMINAYASDGAESVSLRESALLALMTMTCCRKKNVPQITRRYCSGIGDGLVEEEGVQGESIAKMCVWGVEESWEAAAAQGHLDKSQILAYFG